MFTIPANIPPPPQYCSTSCNDDSHQKSYSVCSVESSGQFTSSPKTHKISLEEPNKLHNLTSKVCPTEIPCPISSEICSYNPHCRSASGKIQPAMDCSPLAEELPMVKCDHVTSPVCYSESQMNLKGHYATSNYPDVSARQYSFKNVHNISCSTPMSQPVSWSSAPQADMCCDYG